MLDRIDFGPLRKGVCDSAGKFFAECVRRAPGEAFYGLAVCVDSDVQSFYLQASSEQALGNGRDRFFMNEWKYADNGPPGNDALSAVWDEFDKLRGKLTEAAAEKLWAQVREGCLKAIVEGLQDFRQSKALPAAVRTDFGLFVYDPDPDDVDEAKRMARELNSPKTYKAFIDPDNGYLYA